MWKFLAYVNETFEEKGVSSLEDRRESLVAIFFVFRCLSLDAYQNVEPSNCNYISVRNVRAIYDPKGILTSE